MSKLYFSYEEIQRIVKKSSNEINKLKPDCIIAIGSGGFIPGKMMKECTGLNVYCVTIKLYDDNNKITKKPNIIQWLDKPTKEYMKDKHILVVDEIDDSRSTLAYCTKELKKLNPSKITVFCVHSKEVEKKGIIDNDIKLIFGQTIPNLWIVYPWESDDIIEHNKKCENQSSLKSKYGLDVN